MKKYLIFLSLVGLSIGTTAQTLKINELMQSNVECIMDDIKEFPDSWVLQDQQQKQGEEGLAVA